ncbi:MAG: putative glycolipid-binding domain-containing protein [Solirubrobacteraceae bacterium]
MIVWRGIEGYRTEVADVELRGDGLRASGVQIGVDPEPYRIAYRLDVGPAWVTRSLKVRCGARTLELDPADHDALDCDLAFSPLTNTMPIRRHDLLAPGAQPVEIVTAWVSVPNLQVRRSHQRYEPIDASHVRYVALDGDFSAVLDVDPDGIVRVYEHLARRVA